MLRVWENGLSSGSRAIHSLLRMCSRRLSLFTSNTEQSLAQNIAAQQNHRDACFALTAWYLVGSPGVLPQSDTEAFLWAKKAADQGLAKAQYAVGYFSEVRLSLNLGDNSLAKTYYFRWPIAVGWCWHPPVIT